MEKVRVESKRRVFDGFIKVDEAQIRFQTRSGDLSDPVTRLCVERGDSVSVLIFNKTTEKIILGKQFKYPTLEKGPGWIVETIAGMIDEGETPEAAARREVMEEAGFSVADLTHISTFYVSPGGSSERIILYYALVSDAEKCGEGGGLAEEGEDIEVLELSLTDALSGIQSGDIADAKTIVAIWWLRDNLSSAVGT